MFEGFKFDKNSDRPGSRGESDDPKKVDPSKKNKTSVTVDELPLASPFSINETPRLEEPRSLSLSLHSLHEAFRRGSQASSKSRDSSPVRKGSTSSHKSRFWESRNPDYDSEVPRTGSVNSATDPLGPSPEGSRKASYVPRNAKNSFINTASAAQTAEEKEKLLNQAGITGTATAHRQPSVLSVGSNCPTLAMSMTINNSVPRQPSIAMSTSSSGRNHSLALSDSSEISTSTFSNGRRPSGMIPNSVATRYMRSASLNTTDEETGEPTTRRRSCKSRQNSGGTVKPVQLAPESYMQWQNSVQKSLALSGIGHTLPKPGDSGRLQSLGGIADLAEDADEDAGATPKRSGKNPSFSMVVQPSSPARASRSNSSSKKISVDTSRANSSETDATRMDSGRTGSLADSVSPTNMTFGVVDRSSKAAKSGKTARKVSSGSKETSSKELESLGFTGAVPA